MKNAALITICLGALLVTNAAFGAQYTDSVRFFILEGFFAPPVSADSGISNIDPVHSLARFLAISMAKDNLPSSTAWLTNNPDPLRIPNPFDVTARRSPGLLARTTALLRHYGLTFDIAYPADFAEAEQIAATQISNGYPVIAIHPRPYLLFGYDYREPDPYWYAARFTPADRVEITTRSAWRADWWLWEPDPSSVILMEITGLDSTGITPVPPKVVFTNLLASAKTDTAAGAVSYIRPILQMIDSLSEATAPPNIIHPPEDDADPLYLHRAEMQRLQLHKYLESLGPRARNAEVQQNLRLAMYSASKAADEFAATRRDLYGEGLPAAAADTTTVLEQIHRRWVEHHLDAADHLTEVVRWDRQMLAALKDIAVMDRPFHQ